ncbi:MAG: hypothetical protein JO145_07070 [Acidobacteriaceae bacterium]|nr:hypothetical protein [Acidobacteriaceae bacterium]
MAAPYISGVALQEMHSFFTAFAIASAILLFGVLGYWVVVGKPSEIIWNKPLTTPDQVTYT